MYLLLKPGPLQLCSKIESFHCCRLRLLLCSEGSCTLSAEYNKLLWNLSYQHIWPIPLLTGIQITSDNFQRKIKIQILKVSKYGVTFMCSFNYSIEYRILKMFVFQHQCLAFIVCNLLNSVSVNYPSFSKCLSVCALLQGLEVGVDLWNQNFLWL